jgi:hypothetical protein
MPFTRGDIDAVSQVDLDELRENERAEGMFIDYKRDLYGSTSLFQASQQWSTSSSYDLKIRFESQLSRMNCHTFSTGLSSGHLGAAR